MIQINAPSGRSPASANRQDAHNGFELVLNDCEVGARLIGLAKGEALLGIVGHNQGPSVAALLLMINALG